VADVDQSVRTGVDLLDRLLKDIVSEQQPVQEDQEADPGLFTLRRFIPLLSERLIVMNPYTRLYLVSWISVLQSVPALELLAELPTFLHTLLKYVADVHMPVRTITTNILGEFLLELKADPVPLSLIPILLPFLISDDEETQTIALSWIKEFLSPPLLSLLPEIVVAILPTVASTTPATVRALGGQINEALMELVRNDLESKVQITACVDAVMSGFTHEDEVTRVAALDWLLLLQERGWNGEGGAFETLLSKLHDSSEEVVKRDLHLLATISAASAGSQITDILIGHLVQLFRGSLSLLSTRGSLIIRQLCMSLGVETIYIAFAINIVAEKDLVFAAKMVHQIIFLLSTTSECKSLRIKLREMHTCSHNSVTHSEMADRSNFFCTLYKAASRNPISLLMLCLTTAAYDHAAHLISFFDKIELTLPILLQLDQLVQLLESPEFTFLRLHLLDASRNRSLYIALLGLLMIMPQSKAWNVLKDRMSALPNEWIKHPVDRDALIDQK